MSFLPYSRTIENRFKRIYSQSMSIYCSVGSSKQCPICQWTGHSFITKVYPGKSGTEQICPQCRSYQRHRLAYYFLARELGADHIILHVAPEKMMEEWLRSISAKYLSIDFCRPAMRKMDLTNLDIEDSSYSLIWCSHVLEHIPTDIKAMSEMYRVLRSGGKAIIQVPIYGSSTYEDFSITSPEERLKHFKQEDHVRLYGLDIVKRLESVGLSVEVLNTSEIPTEDMKKYMLDYHSTKEIFVCSKA